MVAVCIVSMPMGGVWRLETYGDTAFVDATCDVRSCADYTVYPAGYGVFSLPITTVSRTAYAGSTIERGPGLLSALGAVWLLSEQPVLTREGH